jgi:hypothetical protein
MDFFTALVTVLMAKYGHEGGIGQIDNRWVDKKPEVEALSQIFIDTAKNGSLVDPQTDALILATQAWYESRVSLKPPDGDPRYQMGKKVGTVVGPMQISKAAPGWVTLWPESEKWKGLNVEKMRDPKTNVDLGYDILKFWKSQCGGSPGVWITAYGWGKCPTKLWNGNRTVDWEGKRRCKTITWMMKKLEKENVYQMPENWSCLTLPTAK